MSRRSPYEQVMSRLERKKGDGIFSEYKRQLNDYRDWLEDKHGISVFEANSLDVENMINDMISSGYSVPTMNIRYAALGEYYKQATRLSNHDQIEPDVENPMQNAATLNS